MWAPTHLPATPVAEGAVWWGPPPQCSGRGETPYPAPQAVGVWRGGGQGLVAVLGTLHPTVDGWGQGARPVGSLQRGGGCGAGEEAVLSVWGCPPHSGGAALAGAMGQAVPWGRQAGRLPGSQLSAGLSGFISSPGMLPAVGSHQGMAGGRTASLLPHGATSTPQPLAHPGCSPGVLSLAWGVLVPCAHPPTS